MAKARLPEEDGRVVKEMQLGKCYVQFRDDFIIKDQKKVEQQIYKIERIMFEGTTKFDNDIMEGMKPKNVDGKYL